MNRRLSWFVAGGLLVALLLAGVGSGLASSSPDGLEYVARKGCTESDSGTLTGTCIAQQEKDHEMRDGPLAGYGIRGIANEYLSTGLSGVLGVLVTFGVGAGIFWLVRRRGQQPAPPAPGKSPGGGTGAT